MGCQEVDTFLAAAFGGGGLGLIPIPSGEGGEEWGGTGAACLLSMVEGPTDRFLTIRME